MVRTCICCKYRVNKHDSDVSLYGFPKDDNILKKWLLVIGAEKKVCESSRICSRHFKKDDFRYSLVGGNRFLKFGAIPSLYLNGVVKDEQSFDSQDSKAIISEEDQTMNKVLNIANLQDEESRNDDQSLYTIKIKEQSSTGNTYEPTQFVSHSETGVSKRLSLSLPGQSEPGSRRKKFLYDVSWEEISTSPVQAKIYWEVAMGKITRQKVVLKTLQQKVRRLKGRIAELRSLVQKKDVNK
ncbi:uncharacterized protein LOC116845400 [Odontomachus brunneus]|uniref:uncharacterized protein LOC116845400 n=1 Tax=Odontomachus brunneus TaxID=486640 RepID=UPI0013F18F8A|nr:uncharacterized protein LOC116845400 [Odontomachus brunneus]